MGLYLCVFDDDDELDGVEIGHYSDFSDLRDYIGATVEGSSYGSRFPTFQMHSDCDGEWTPRDCVRLRLELRDIRAALEVHPPRLVDGGWQQEVAKFLGLTPKNAFESFMDVDGEPVVGRIQSLVELALARQLPILFQ